MRTFLSLIVLLMMVVNAYGEGRRVAVIVGVGDYPQSSGLSVLTAHDDTESLAKVLRELDPKWEVTLLNCYQGSKFQPNRSNIFRTFGIQEASDGKSFEITERSTLLGKGSLKKEDTVLVYFGSHGMYDQQSGELHLIPKDGRFNTKTNNLDGKVTVPRFYLEKALRESGAGTAILVMDACRSGVATVRGVDDKQVPVRANVYAAPDQKIQKLQSSGQKFIEVYSAELDQYAHEMVGAESGVFTFYFTEALRGAKFAPEINGYVTLESVFKWVQDKTSIFVSQMPNRQSQQKPRISGDGANTIVIKKGDSGAESGGDLATTIGAYVRRIAENPRSVSGLQGSGKNLVGWSSKEWESNLEISETPEVLSAEIELRCKSDVVTEEVKSDVQRVVASLRAMFDEQSSQFETDSFGDKLAVLVGSSKDFNSAAILVIETYRNRSITIRLAQRKRAPQVLLSAISSLLADCVSISWPSYVQYPPNIGVLIADDGTFANRNFAKFFPMNRRNADDKNPRAKSMMADYVEQGVKRSLWVKSSDNWSELLLGSDPRKFELAIVTYELVEGSVSMTCENEELAKLTFLSTYEFLRAELDRMKAAKLPPLSVRAALNGSYEEWPVMIGELGQYLKYDAAGDTVTVTVAGEAQRPKFIGR